MINSNYSGNAPTDFKIYSSTESQADIIDTNTINCDICESNRLPLYCIRCLNNGDFIYSKEYKYSISNYYIKHSSSDIDEQLETYSLKKQRLAEIKKLHEELTLKASSELENKLSLRRKKNLISRRKLDLNILQEIINNIRTSINNIKEMTMDVEETNTYLRIKASNHSIKIKRIGHYTTISSEELRRKRYTLDDSIRCLATVRKGRIHDLCSYIFPIVHMRVDTSTTDSMINEISEAVHNTYIGDKWVDTSHDHYYTISGAGLPADGNYSQFSSYLSDQYMSGMDGLALNLEDTNVIEVGAALGHIAQCSLLTANILDCLLIVPCNFREFTSRCLKEKRFKTIVKLLNFIIFNLCATQRVDIIDSRTTCTNLLSLINSSDLGKIQSYQHYDDISVQDNDISSGDESGGEWDFLTPNNYETSIDSATMPTRVTTSVSLISNLWKAAKNLTEKK